MCLLSVRVFCVLLLYLCVRCSGHVPVSFLIGMYGWHSTTCCHVLSSVSLLLRPAPFFWLLVVGFWLVVAGWWFSAAGCWLVAATWQAEWLVIFVVAVASCMARCLRYCVRSVQVLFRSYSSNVVFEMEGMTCWFYNVLLELFRSCSGHICLQQIWMITLLAAPVSGLGVFLWWAGHTLLFCPLSAWHDFCIVFFAVLGVVFRHFSGHVCFRDLWYYIGFAALVWNVPVMFLSYLFVTRWHYLLILLYSSWGAPVMFRSCSGHVPDTFRLRCSWNGWHNITCSLAFAISAPILGVKPFGFAPVSALDVFMWWVGHAFWFCPWSAWQCFCNVFFAMLGVVFRPCSGHCLFRNWWYYIGFAALLWIVPVMFLSYLFVTNLSYLLVLLHWSWGAPVMFRSCSGHVPVTFRLCCFWTVGRTWLAVAFLPLVPPY